MITEELALHRLKMLQVLLKSRNEYLQMQWIEQSVKLENLELEICFPLQDDFYIGDPNDHQQLQDERYYKTLELPKFQRVVEVMARSGEAFEHQQELATYYQTIVEEAELLKKSFEQIRHYFWLRLWIWNTPNNIHISFPWYDSLSEIQKFFAWIKTPSDKAFIDMDQGWQIEAIQTQDAIHIRQTDPDFDEELANIAVPKQPFVELVSQVEARTQRIIDNLSRTLGADVWSQYQNEVHFGTPTWSPKTTK
ncbi:hypothetical protein [Celerinatantimonas sp. MCCC 1A17872]|uniref:hypothetical protein n=1 Tax=Celerinatantimonas sp. MCCC 1A17872 TaxID=3177514 RepID=UPI0038BFA8D5